jgi:predicted Fe-Mo cluster-binding NifX family protein
MKIAVATNKGGLEDMVSPVFGRCQTYTLVECEGGEIKKTEAMANPGFTAAGGAGIQAAQYVGGLKPEAVIAGNFGPNAAAVLTQMGVKMVQAQGNAGEAVLKYMKGELKPTNTPTVRGHFGMGRRGFGGGMGRGGRWR